MAMCKTSVESFYTIVMEHVISNLRETFKDERVDEQVLEELKILWEEKLLASRGVDVNAEPSKSENPGQNNTTNITQTASQYPFYQSNLQQSQVFANPENVQAIQQLDANHAIASMQGIVDTITPIQITMPTQPTIDSVTRVLTIDVPASALNGPLLNSLLTGPVISATMGLPDELATSVLQQHVNAALRFQIQIYTISQTFVIPEIDGAADDCCEPNTNRSNKKKAKGKKRPITIEFVSPGVDGIFDSSDDDSSEENDSDEDKEENNTDYAPDSSTEDDPLNSDDDVTDEEITDTFDTDNVVMCQYEKVGRQRNKWKFFLKDGIMILNGEDFVFRKAVGDAEW